MKAVSLFSGAGGMDLGFSRAGFTIIWSNDIDPFAVATHKKNFPNCNATLGDITLQELPHVRGLDLVFGGPPCQGFSVAGKMNPNDPRSKHVWNFLGVVKKLRPRAFVMENVKALAENTRWKTLRDELQAAAEGLGYQTKIFVLNASDFGVPQNRERMFLVGIKGAKPQAPKPITEKKKPTILEFLSKIPQYKNHGNDSICTAKIVPAKNPILRKSPYAGMLFNGQGRPLNPHSQATTLPASMGGNRTPIIDQSLLDGNQASWINSYHKKLLTSGKPVKKVPDFLRRITVEEAAIIQTFPVSMEFSGSLTTKYRQIGNAVPPELAYHVAKSVLRVLQAKK